MDTCQLVAVSSDVPRGQLTQQSVFVRVVAVVELGKEPAVGVPPEPPLVVAVGLTKGEWSPPWPSSNSQHNRTSTRNAGRTVVFRAAKSAGLSSIVAGTRPRR
jgi:hypothetical protein